MATLREIDADLQALEDLLMEVGGDVTDEAANAAIEEWFEQNQEALKAKLDGYATLIGTLEGRQRARLDEAKRLQVMAHQDGNAAKRLKERLRWYFTERGITKVETNNYKISLANNGGPVPVLFDSSVRPADIAESPEYGMYVDTQYVWSNATIRYALEDGKELPFAFLGERGTSIRIK